MQDSKENSSKQIERAPRDKGFFIFDSELRQKRNRIAFIVISHIK